MSYYIASYDIQDDRIRERVAKILLRYGVRLQFSVFELDIEAEDIGELQTQIGQQLGREDAFELIPVDCDPQRRRLSWQADLADYDPVIVIE